MQPYPLADNWIKALLSKALYPRANPSFPHHQSLPSEGLHKSLIFLHQRTDRRSKRNHNLTVTKTKPHYRKLISTKKQKVASQMKGQDKNLEKQLNEMEIGNFPEKEFRIMIVNMILDLRKRMEAKTEKKQYLPTT